MKILIYTYSWFPKIDGVTIRYKNIIDNLKVNNEIHLIVPDLIDSPRVEDYDGITITTIKGRALPNIAKDENPDVIIPDLRYSSNIYNKLFKYCIDNEIDIIHIASPDPIISIFQLIRLHTGIPIISVYHTDVLEYLKVSNNSNILIYFTWYIHLLNTYFLVDCFSTTSQSMISKIKNYGFYLSDRPIWLLPISINTKLFKPSVPEYISQWHENKIRLLYVGRITKEKSINRILESMDDSMSLIIIGHGGSIPYLKNISESQNLNVKFIDTIEQSKLPNWYSSCDIFIMPSSTETLGFVTLEAMSSGAPVCAFSAGGTLDLIIHDHNGLFFENKRELQNNINRLYTDKLLRDKIINNAINYTSEKSVELSISKLYEKYKDIINKYRGCTFNFFMCLFFNSIIYFIQILYNFI